MCISQTQAQCQHSKGIYSIYYCITSILSGWWFQPLWKNMSQLGLLFRLPIYNCMESHKIHVPNHQPAVIPSAIIFHLNMMMFPWISHGYVRGFHNRALPKSNNPPPSSAMAGADTAVAAATAAAAGGTRCTWRCRRCTGWRCSRWET